MVNRIRSPKIVGLFVAVCLTIAAGCAATCLADNGDITATVQPNQDVGVAFPPSIGTGAQYSPEGGLFDVTVTLVPASGWSFVPSSVGAQGDGATIWSCSGSTTTSGTGSGSSQTWEGVGVTNADSWSDVLFAGQLTQSTSGGSGGSGPCNPTTFDASVADISIYVDALGSHSDGPTGNWPPEMSSQEHDAETADQGGFFLPSCLVRTGSDGFPQQLPAGSGYKILALRLPTQWVGQPNPDTVGSVTFTVPTGVALYHGAGGSVSGGTLVASGSIRVPAAGFRNETFAILTDQNFTQVGAMVATYTWDSNLSGGPSTGQDFAKLVPYSVQLIIDSDNNDGLGVPDGNPAELAAKMQEPGKIIAANNGDTNMNGVPDYADLDLSGAVDDPPLVPVVLKVCFLGDPANTTVRFDYGGILPTPAQFIGVPLDGGFTNYTPVKQGTLRLWNVRSTRAVRTADDFIVTGHDYPASQLGFSPGSSGVQQVTYYAEGINAGEQDISVSGTFQPYGSTTISASDRAKTTVVDPAILFNCSNGSADGSSHNLPLGVPDVDYDINAADELIKDQITSPTFWWRDPDAAGDDVTESTVVDAQPFIIRIPQVLIDQGFQFFVNASGLVGDSEVRIYAAASPGGDGGNRLLYVSTPQYAEQQVGRPPVAILKRNSPQPIQLAAGTNELIAMAKNNSGVDQQEIQLALRMVRNSGVPLLTPYDANTVRLVVAKTRDFWTEFNCRLDAVNPAPQMRPSPNYPLEDVPNTNPIQVRFDQNMQCFPSAAINPQAVGCPFPLQKNPHQCYFMFVHGYNVSADDARKSNDALFKNLFLGLGFRGHYVGFLWQGDKWDLPGANFSAFRPNVQNALQSGRCVEEALVALKRAVMQTTAGTGTIDVMAHSLGNLTMWEGARLLQREDPLNLGANGTYARNCMMVEAAVQQEAFYPQGLYTNSDNWVYSSADLTSHSWAFWFNQANHNSSSVFRQVNSSYNPNDTVLTFAMRSSDWAKTLPQVIPLPPLGVVNLGRPSLHFARILDPALLLGPYPLRTLAPAPGQLPPVGAGNYWYQLYEIPALMRTRLPIYLHTNLQLPIGASAAADVTNGLPPGWNLVDASKLNWQGHNDGFVNQFFQMNAWYTNFVRPNIMINVW